MDMTEVIDQQFTYHQPNGNQLGRYEDIREKARDFAHFLDFACPASAEKTFALHYLDMAVMNANAAIARHDR